MIITTTSEYLLFYTAAAAAVVAIFVKFTVTISYERTFIIILYRSSCGDLCEHTKYFDQLYRIKILVNIIHACNLRTENERR